MKPTKTAKDFLSKLPVGPYVYEGSTRKGDTLAVMTADGTFVCEVDNATSGKALASLLNLVGGHLGTLKAMETEGGALMLAQACEVVTVAERLLTTAALLLARTIHGGTPMNVDTLEAHAQRIEAAETAVKLAALNYAKKLAATGFPEPKPITLDERKDH